MSVCVCEVLSQKNTDNALAKHGKEIRKPEDFTINSVEIRPMDGLRCVYILIGCDRVRFLICFTVEFLVVNLTYLIAV